MPKGQQYLAAVNWHKINMDPGGSFLFSNYLTFKGKLNDALVNAFNQKAWIGVAGSKRNREH